MTHIDAIGPGARTIAADIMCGNARSITVGEIWAHIGQAYDTAEIDASIADEVADLIAKTGIDLIWPDGSKNTELDAARVEIERLLAELAEVRNQAHRDATERDTLREVAQRNKQHVATLTEVVERVDKVIEHYRELGTAAPLGAISEALNGRSGVAR